MARGGAEGVGLGGGGGLPVVEAAAEAGAEGAVGEGLDGREGHGGEHQHPASSCHDARTGARPALRRRRRRERDPAATAAGGAGERRRRRSGGGIGGTHLSASRRLIAKGEREEVGRTRGAMLITSRCTVLARGIFCAGGSTV